MTPDEIFERMAAIASAADYPLLKHYRQDLEIHDRQFLANAWSPESRMLWIVRESGTTLVPLGMCEEVSDWGRAAMSTGGAMEFHLADQSGLTRLSKDKALAQLSIYGWSTRSGRICKGSRALADVADVAIQRKDNRLWAETKLASLVTPDALTLGDAIGMLQMAERAAIHKAGTIFCHTKSIQLDGQDLHALVDAKRSAWLGASKADSVKVQSKAGARGKSRGSLDLA